VDSAGDVYVTGQTSVFTKPHADHDAFMSKLNPAGSVLVYSTYIGGSGLDLGSAIAVDSSGNAYITGETESTDFPVTPGAFQTAYGGDEDAFVVKINPLPATTTTLSSAPNPSAYGQPVVFTAAVTSGGGAPPDGEAVTFMKSTTVLGTGSLSGSSASFTTSTLKVGTNSITAVYGGDSNFTGSTSKAVKQVVSKAATTTTLASSLNPSNVGQSVTFTASVTSQFGGTPTGKVTFYDGTTLLKTVSVNGGVAEFGTRTLAVGSHSITATYNGSTDFTGSSGSVVQTVN